MAYQYVGESSQSGSKNSSQKYRYSSEQYDSLLEEYKNNPYVLEKLQNNPYLEFEDQPTIFGYIGDNTGLWESAFSKRMKERENLFNQYNADVIADWQNQQRNSPLTQKGLSQDAGMNPDITGVPEGNADSIPTNANEPGLTYDSSQSFQSIAGTISNAFTTALDLFQKGSQITSVIEGIKSAKTARREALRNEFYSMVADRFPIDEPLDFVGSKNDINDSQLIAYGVNKLDSKVPYLGLTRINGMPYWKILRKYVYGNNISVSDAKYIANLGYELSYNSSKIKGILQERKTKYYEDRVRELTAKSDGHYNGIVEVAEKLAESLSEVNKKGLEYQAHSDALASRNDYAYNYARNGNKNIYEQATYEDTEGYQRGHYEGSKSYLQRAMLREVNNVTSTIEDLADNGNEFAPFFLLAMNLLYIYRLGI